MEQIRKIESFRQEAGFRLPGVLYGFNIADLKRRNAYLGWRTGDEDIKELDRLLTAMQSDAVLVARTQSNRWLMLTQENENDRVQAVLDRYKKTELFSAGWEIRAFKSGQQKICRESVSAQIKRAVRCLYTPIKTRADLSAAIQQINEGDYALPVNRPLALSEISTAMQENRDCLFQCPEHSPECPYCGEQDFAWEDDNEVLLRADGTCTGCGAKISICDISQALGMSSLSYA
jgi:GGDEF domain-containing protein